MSTIACAGVKTPQLHLILSELTKVSGSWGAVRLGLGLVPFLEDQLVVGGAMSALTYSGRS
jgi:hypothetical protein